MTPTLELKQLRFAYGKEEVLKNIDLTLMAGEFVALIGPNGSGKTTLLQCLGGILSPSSGSVEISGFNLSTDTLKAKQSLGFAVDPGRLPPLLTGRECLQLFAEARALTGIPEETYALAAQLAFMPVLDRRVSHYSLGMRQKLGILLGLLGDPALLVLDEPLNGLDPVSAYALKRHLQMLTRERQKTVLLATHSLDVAERFIARAVLLMDGQLIRSWNENDLNEIRSDPTRSLEQEMVKTLA